MEVPEKAVEAIISAWEKRGEFSPPGDDFELAEIALQAALPHILDAFREELLEEIAEELDRRARDSLTIYRREGHEEDAALVRSALGDSDGG